jgi:choline dehydrogenase-like flavoprotein
LSSVRGAFLTGLAFVTELKVTKFSSELADGIVEIMFVDGRRVERDTKLDADICIVGAGAAGLTLACQFADTPVRICLLESGDLHFDWQTQALYEGRNVGLRYFDLDVCQIRYFGGNTNAWGGWCRPLDAIDFRDRSWVEGGGWPFSLAELEPYYRGAHTICQIPAAEYGLEAVLTRLGRERAHVVRFDPAKLETSIYQFSPPTLFGQVYREGIGRAQNIVCVLNANALRIQVAEDTRSATEVAVGCLSGTRFGVRAKYFVLAAGGIENTRLLLLSNDVAPKGLGNRYDLVGRYFMEHPHTKRALISAQRPASFSLYGLHFRDHAVSARLSLPAALQERERLLNYSANIHPIYIGHDSVGWLAFRKLVLSLDPSRRNDPYVRFAPYGRKGITFGQLYHILRHFHKVTIAAFLQLLQPNRLVSGFILESKSEQAPNWHSRVTLQQERDEFGLNRVQLDWRMLPIDRRTVIRGEEIIDQELRRLGIGELAPLHLSETENWPANLEGGWHQIGTTRAHPDPRRGVVDANGRVHDMSNLFIAGSSVFPTSGAAPPTLTITAMALRLADHLKRTLRQEREVMPAVNPARAAS